MRATLLAVLCLCALLATTVFAGFSIVPPGMVPQSMRMTNNFGATLHVRFQKVGNVEWLEMFSKSILGVTRDIYEFDGTITRHYASKNNTACAVTVDTFSCTAYTATGNYETGTSGGVTWNATIYERRCTNITDATTTSSYIFGIDSQGILRYSELPSSFGTAKARYDTHVLGAIITPSHWCISARDGFGVNAPVGTQAIVPHVPWGCPLDCAASYVLDSTATTIPRCPKPHPNAVCNNNTARWEITGSISMDSFTDLIWCPTHVIGDITASSAPTTLRFSSCGRLSATGSIELAGTPVTVNSTATAKYNGQSWALITSNSTCEPTRVTLNPVVFGFSPCPTFAVNGVFSIQFSNGTCPTLSPRCPVTPPPTPTPRPTPTPTPTPTPVDPCLIGLRYTTDHTFTLDNDSFNSWQIEGCANPTVTIKVGATYTFNVLNPSSHPLYIRDEQGTNVANGTSGFGTSTVLYTPVSTAAGKTYTYICGNHPGMVGNLIILSDVIPPSPAPTPVVASSLFSPSSPVVVVPSPAGSSPSSPMVGVPSTLVVDSPTFAPSPTIASPAIPPTYASPSKVPTAVTTTASHIASSLLVIFFAVCFGL